MGLFDSSNGFNSSNSSNGSNSSIVRGTLELLNLWNLGTLEPWNSGTSETLELYNFAAIPHFECCRKI